MRLSTFAVVAGIAATEVAAHATFQQLFVNGADQGSSCARLPISNSPVQDVSSNNIRCNANSGPVGGKCGVKAGDTVTIEMHQQPNDRSCSSEAIGGAHYGPVNVYMSKVSDSSSADGSSGFFKIFADSWSKASGSSSGDSDYWGTKDLNNCCGRMDVKIPSDIPAGDYLLRAEVIALHAASGSGGAQFYITCYQLTVTGGGSASPATVNFPGAYKASDPGILVNIHMGMSGYTNPGPAVISSGTTRTPGNKCSGYDSKAAPGAGGGSSGGGGGGQQTTTRPATTTFTTSQRPTTSAGGGSGNCAQKYAQCGGKGWNGPTCCASGSTCTANGEYYSQCT